MTDINNLMNNFEKLYVKNNNSKQSKMNTISLCGSETQEIIGKQKQEIYELLNNYYGYDQERVVELKNINNLNERFLISIELENSYKCIICLVTCKNKKYSLLLCNNKIYTISMRFDDDLYKGTILSGEIVKNTKNCWIFYMDDIFYYKNQYYQQQNLSKKIMTMNDILKNDYIYDDILNNFHIQIKTFFIFNHLNFIKKSCRLFFISDNSPTKFYLDVKVEQKIKPEYQDGETKQFLTKKTEKIDVYKLYDNNNQFINVACISKLKYSLFMKNLFKNKDEQKILYKYNGYFKSWEPVI